MVRAYFISGLGADETVFDRLQLRQDVHVTHLPWLVPEPEESITSYAKRMASSIDQPEGAVLVGLSFGGIMALEITKHISIKKVVLISSVKSKTELPINFDLIGLMKLHHLVPASRLMHIKELSAWFFGVRKEDERNTLFRILDRSDQRIVDWSTDQIMNWSGNHAPDTLMHIHGTADTVFPIRNIRPDHKVKGGPHFMVYTHAAEVSAWLNEVL